MVIPELRPVSNLQRDYKSVVRELSNGPVVIIQQSKPVAIMLSPDTYRHFTDMETEYRRLQRIVQADQDFEDMANGKFTEG